MTYTPVVWADGDCVMAADMNNIENGVDRAQGDVMNLRGLTAARPASDATLIGRKYRATDAPYEVSRDNGAGWDVVGYTNSAYTALGDIQVATAANAAAPLGIGAAGEVLTVAGGTATWAAAAGGAWTLIAETILVAPAATVTFAAIPGTYRTLAIFGQARDDTVAELAVTSWRANGDSGNNYDTYMFQLMGNNLDSAINQGRGVAQANWGRIEAANSRANSFSPVMSYWQGYALADREKFCMGYSIMMGNVDAAGDMGWQTAPGRWRNTAAITSLTLLAANNFVAGSRFTLYGIT